MKFKFHSIVLYILLVILPTTGIGATFYSYHSYKMKQENKQVAHTVLFLYRDYLDHHLGEAISALEMLTKVVGTETGNINGMKEIVHDTDGNDARFLVYITLHQKVSLQSHRKVTDHLLMSQIVNIFKTHYKLRKQLYHPSLQIVFLAIKLL